MDTNYNTPYFFNISGIGIIVFFFSFVCLLYCFFYKNTSLPFLGKIFPSLLDKSAVQWQKEAALWNEFLRKEENMFFFLPSHMKTFTSQVWNFGFLYVLICKIIVLCQFSGILPFVRVYNTPLYKKKVNSELLPFVIGRQKCPKIIPLSREIGTHAAHKAFKCIPLGAWPGRILTAVCAQFIYTKTQAQSSL